MLSNISIPLLGIADTAILGHLDDAFYLGAVSVGSSIMAMVLWTFSFLRTSTTGLTAQQHGADSSAAIQTTLYRAMLLSILLSLVLFALRPLILSVALGFVDASPTVNGLAKSYSSIRFYSLPAVLLTYCLTGWLIGIQNTRAVMLILITTNSLNIVLDLVFIVSLGLQSDGAAWATVIAEYTGCAIAVSVFIRHYRAIKGRRWPGFHTLFDLEAILKLLKMNGDLMLRTFCLLFCFLFLSAKGAQQGDLTLAANAILLQLVLLSAFALDGFAHAAESLCGFAIGRRDVKQFHATVKACLWWCLGTSLVITLLLLLGRDVIVYQYSSIEAVQRELTQYFYWLLALPLAAVWCYLFDGVFIGAAQTKAMRNSMVACTLLVFLPLWYVSQEMGNHGLWMAFLVFNAFRGLTLGVYYWVYSRRGVWMA